VFRTREFEQMELEYFCHPDEAAEAYEYWCQHRYQWYLDLGIPSDELRLRAHDDDELSHYSSGTSDVEFLFPWGWDELEGIANRGDYDLTQHAEHSGERLEWFDQASGERWVPHVIEPAAGATRTAMAFLMAAYTEEEVRGETRVVLRFHPRIAPYKVAVLPLSKKPELSGPASELAAGLRKQFMCDYDETQAIGRRYRRQDEIGTPYCVTFDFDSLDDDAVTVRDRDTMDQDRVPIAGVADYLAERLQ
jgi:glycyl-tRNA synthetase